VWCHLTDTWYKVYTNVSDAKLTFFFAYSGSHQARRADPWVTDPYFTVINDQNVHLMFPQVRVSCIRWLTCCLVSCQQPGILCELRPYVFSLLMYVVTFLELHQPCLNVGQYICEMAFPLGGQHMTISSRNTPHALEITIIFKVTVFSFLIH
jgi:hypothetical protein